MKMFYEKDANANLIKDKKVAIESLNSGDILVVAGKGHEIYQERKGKKKIFF